MLDLRGKAACEPSPFARSLLFSAHVFSRQQEGQSKRDSVFWNVPNQLHPQAKRSHHAEPVAAPTDSTSSFIAAHHPEKPSARAQTTDGRTWTLSIAIPGSIVLNAQTQELRAWLAGQVS